MYPGLVLVFALQLAVPSGAGAATSASKSDAEAAPATDVVAPSAEPVAEPAKKASRRIAVYRLAGAGTDERVVDVLTDSVVAELRKLERVTVVGMDEIRAMLDLEAQKQILGCSDASCLAEIGEALGVDAVMIGSVAVVGDAIAFGLKHIDQQSATTLGQYTSRVDSVDPADVLALIGPAVQELFPNTPLKPGATRGVPPEIFARIHPPPLDPWVFWSVTATAGVATASGLVFTAWNFAAYTSAIDKATASIAGPPASGKDINRDVQAAQTSFIGLTSSFAVAALAGAGAGVVALFTDWENVGGAE